PSAEWWPARPSWRDLGGTTSPRDTETYSRPIAELSLQRRAAAIVRRDGLGYTPTPSALAARRRQVVYARTAPALAGYSARGAAVVDVGAAGRVARVSDRRRVGSPAAGFRTASSSPRGYSAECG